MPACHHRKVNVIKKSKLAASGFQTSHRIRRGGQQFSAACWPRRQPFVELIARQFVTFVAKSYQSPAGHRFLSRRPILFGETNKCRCSTELQRRRVARNFKAVMRSPTRTKLARQKRTISPAIAAPPTSHNEPRRWAPPAPAFFPPADGRHCYTGPFSVCLAPRCRAEPTTGA